MSHRAYSTFAIKSIDEAQGLIEGVASTPETDRQGDILEPDGAQFTLPMPLLWQHRHDQPIGHVIAARVTKSGIHIRAQLAKAGIAPFIDQARQLIGNGLVRGLSVGFQALESSQTKTGYRFTKWAWHELSTVTIPANVSGSIQVIKSLDEAARAVLGNSGRPSSPHPSGAADIHHRKSGAMSTHKSDQIEKVQHDLDEKTAKLRTLDDKETMTDEETSEADALTKDVQLLTKKVERMKAIELAELSNGGSVPNGKSFRDASDSRGISRVEVNDYAKDLPKGTLFTRYAMAVAAGKGSISDTLAYAKRWDSQTPEVSAYIKAEAGTTTGTSPGWGAELVPSRTLTSEFVELVRAATVLDKMTGFRRVPPRVNIQVQTGGSTFEWVGETGVKPVGELDFTTIPIGDHKVAGIVVISEELVRRSEPSAEEAVRRDLVAQCARFIDTQFLTTTVTAGASNPASITNGVASPAASGTDADALYVDLNIALATFDNADVGTSNIYVVTTPALARGISTLRNALGQFEFSGISMTGGTLVGMPVIVSSVVQSGHLFLIKADEIFLADEGRVRIDASNQATLDMAGGASPTFNLWQRNCIGLRAEQFITWAKRRAESVAIIDTAAYGPSVGSP